MYRFFFACFVLVSSAWAANVAPVKDSFEQRVQRAFPGVQIERIRKAPVSGWYEVYADGQLFYVDDSAKYWFNGQLFQVDKGQVINLTQASLQAIDNERAPEREKILKAIPDNQLVVYPAKNEKHRIDVFVDVNCGYCRKLHRHIHELNQLGITVRYLAFPRAGLNSGSARILTSVWCAKDRAKAMTRAMKGQPIETRQCDAPIAEHYALVRKFGLRGTPAIVLANGEIIPGYVEPERLLKEIKQRGL